MHINSKYEMYKNTRLLSISYCKIYESSHLTFKYTVSNYASIKNVLFRLSSVERFFFAHKNI